MKIGQLISLEKVFNHDFIHVYYISEAIFSNFCGGNVIIYNSQEEIFSLECCHTAL